jgi:hypothetical protein
MSGNNLDEGMKQAAAFIKRNKGEDMHELIDGFPPGSFLGDCVATLWRFITTGRLVWGR